jgi:hypothetical protein
VRQRFVANLLSVRSVLIFAAGFIMALLLARTMPGTELFHPEGQMFRRDAVITGAGPQNNIGGFQLTTSIGGFDVPSSAVFVNGVFEQVKDKAPGQMQIPVIITYVLPKAGYQSAVLIEPRS